VTDVDVVAAINPSTVVEPWRAARSNLRRARDDVVRHGRREQSAKADFVPLLPGGAPDSS
jgi:hypothetical protein